MYKHKRGEKRIVLFKAFKVIRVIRRFLFPGKNVAIMTWQLFGIFHPCSLLDDSCTAFHVYFPCLLPANSFGFQTNCSLPEGHSHADLISNVVMVFPVHE